MSTTFNAIVTVTGERTKIDDLFKSIAGNNTVFDFTKLSPPITNHQSFATKRIGDDLHFSTSRYSTWSPIYLLSVNFPELRFNWMDINESEYYTSYFYEAIVGDIELVSKNGYGRDGNPLKYIGNSENGRIAAIEENRRYSWDQEDKNGLNYLPNISLREFDEYWAIVFKNVEFNEHLCQESNAWDSMDEYFYTVIDENDSYWE